MPNTTHHIRIAFIFTLCFVLSVLLGAADNWLDPYRAASSRIVATALKSDAAWQRLAFLTDTFGSRLSGSPQLEATLRWAAEELKKDFDEVRLDPVMVPHWVRGAESLEIIEPQHHDVVMLGLGNSIGTPSDGIQAELLVVKSFADLDANRDRVSGRIVLFNVPYTTYGETVQYRTNGASRAAAYGAVAALVRSIGPAGFRTPHTGALRYALDQPQIPAAAVTAEDADRLQRMQDRDTSAVLRLKMDAKFLPDAASANIIAEYRGREKPDELVVISGHIDSWDVGTGAIDNGGGCMVMWEAVRVLKQLNLRPRRTIRLVFWVNEENGLRGGIAYRDRYKKQLANHVLMMESDGGVFRPLGFGFSGSELSRARVSDIAALLHEVGSDRIGPNGGGADIGPSVEAGNIPAMSLDVDGSKYFLIHHTPADTVDKIDPADMSRCVASAAVMAYVVADMPQRLNE
jgi:carboxypeptidase Q